MTVAEAVLIDRCAARYISSTSHRQWYRPTTDA